MATTTIEHERSTTKLFWRVKQPGSSIPRDTVSDNSSEIVMIIIAMIVIIIIIIIVLADCSQCQLTRINLLSLNKKKDQ